VGGYNVLLPLTTSTLLPISVLSFPSSQLIYSDACLLSLLHDLHFLTSSLVYLVFPAACFPVIIPFIRASHGHMPLILTYIGQYKRCIIAGYEMAINYAR